MLLYQKSQEQQQYAHVHNMHSFVGWQELELFTFKWTWCKRATRHEERARKQYKIKYYKKVTVKIEIGRETKYPQYKFNDNREQTKSKQNADTNTTKNRTKTHRTNPPQNQANTEPTKQTLHLWTNHKV